MSVSSITDTSQYLTFVGSQALAWEPGLGSSSFPCVRLTPSWSLGTSGLYPNNQRSLGTSKIGKRIYLHFSYLEP